MNSLRVVCSHIKSWNTAAETLISTDTQSTNTYDDVVQGFEANQKELHQLRQQLAAMQADLTAEKVRTSSFEQTIANQRASLRGLETKANKLTGENKSLRVVHATNQKLLLQVRELQRSAAGAHADRKKIMAEQVRYQRLQQDRDQLRQQCILHQQCMKEMQLDLEYLKCTEPARDVVKRTVTPLPFVVVLVDGDAYSWAPGVFFDHGQQRTAPGAFAASRLFSNVMDYIYNSKTISSTAKVVVRVVYNESGKMGAQRHRSGVVRQDMNTFRRQFTEADPLFDFFDCGTGKERADVKIKENFHLFLSNPYCEHLFLATCTDNGFARMLEPYRYNDVRDKITMVRAGYVCREIANLNLSSVAWPDVFADRAPPQSDAAAQLRRAQIAGLEDAHNKRLGLDGSRNDWIAASVKDSIEGHDAWLAQLSGRVGQREMCGGIRTQALRQSESPAVPAMITSSPILHDVNDATVD